MDLERYFLPKILERYFLPKYLGDPNLVDLVSDLLLGLLSYFSIGKLFKFLM
jgi:hypothetical protein